MEVPTGLHTARYPLPNLSSTLLDFRPNLFQHATTFQLQAFCGPGTHQKQPEGLNLNPDLHLHVLQLSVSAIANVHCCVLKFLNKSMGVAYGHTHITQSTCYQMTAKQVATLFRFGFVSNTFDSHSEKEQHLLLSSSPPDEAVTAGDYEHPPRKVGY